MIKFTGKYGEAKVFTDILEKSTSDQIQDILDHVISKDAHTRIMPDCHYGSGCVIGYTAKIHDKVIPNLVGVDIGCGVCSVKFNKENINFNTLDKFIFKNIPLSKDINKKPPYALTKKYLVKLKSLCQKININYDKVLGSLGTLGGGNHFIEIEKSETSDSYYLTVHTGSRNFGYRVAKYHQNIADNGTVFQYNQLKGELIKKLKSQGKHSEIQKRLNDLKNSLNNNNELTGLEFLEGNAKDEYLNDVAIVQEYAQINRNFIIRSIMKRFMKTPIIESIESVHNYIDIESGIIRKGAISAKLNEKVVIPLSMKDGILLCEGKGNDDWNNSAPHGAGRKMSRSEARKNCDLSTYIKDMTGIHSSTISEKTLDENPRAYKDPHSIIRNIADTVRIYDHARPVYVIKG